MPAAGDKKVRPLQGGTRIFCHPDSTNAGLTRTGTLGLVFADGAGDLLFATAGHVVGNGVPADRGVLVEQPGNGQIAGLVDTNFLSDDHDFAIVEVAAGVQGAVGEVWIGDGQHITVQLTKTLPAKGSAMVLQGAVTGAVPGIVVENDADITDLSTGKKVMHVATFTFTGIHSAAGDSGAPVVGQLQNGAPCYGVHGGSTRIGNDILGWFSPFAAFDLP